VPGKRGIFKIRLIDVARKTRLRIISANTDVSSLLFSKAESQQASRLFFKALRDHGGSLSRHEVSQFATDLYEGNVEEGFHYSRKNFYETVLRRLVDIGFIGLNRFFEHGHGEEKYAPIYQPIPTTPPGGRNFYNLAWQLCQKWNQEWQ